MSDDLYYSTVVGAVNPDTSGTRDPSDWFIRYVVGGLENDSGVDVNERTILTSGPVWQAVNVIAGDLSQLPIHMYRKDGEKKIREETHPATWLLEREPHPEIGLFNFRHTMQAWVLLWGNACAYIDRNGRGEPISLTPLRPDLVRLERDDKGALWYLYTDKTKPFYMRPENVFHIQGMGSALWGYSVIEYAANSVGFGLALQKYGNKQFANGAKPGGVIELEGRMNRDDRLDFRREWEELHRGVENSHKVAILQQGAKFHALTIPNDAAQFVELLKHVRESAAAWFNLPPYKLGAMENSAVRANLEQQNQDYFQNTLMPHVIKWEQESERKLLTVSQRRSRKYFFKFNMDAAMRPDTKTRYESYTMALQWGIMNVNEVRSLEDKNSIGDQGDVYLRPLNMVDASLPAEPTQTEQPPSDTTTPPDEQVTESQARAAITLMMRSTADKMCRIEQERLRRATKADNFCEAVTGFYASFQTKLVGALREVSEVSTVLGVPSGDLCQLVDSYCASACERVLEISGTVSTTDELRDAIDNLSWEASSHQLTNLFLKGNSNEVVSSVG